MLYTGNGTSQSLTGVGFQPDLTWIKGRSVAEGQMLFDAVRGAGRRLMPHGNNAENYDAAIYLTAFNSDGFSVGGDEGVNDDTETFVAWNWLAGNATLGTGDFTQGTSASTCSRNVDAGFSIVSYTGTGANATIGHGLSKAPEMIIVKKRNDTGDWMVQANNDNTDYLRMNTTHASTDSDAAWNDTSPTATLFSVGTDGAVNNNTQTFIAYCFHSVDGYSKFGGYEGNREVDGPFIYTGFRPAYVVTKVIDDAHHWTIYNTDKATYNHDATTAIYANENSAEGTGAVGTRRIDFLSNVFKLRHNSYDGNWDISYIYFAFAETPFKYSNAR